MPTSSVGGACATLETDLQWAQMGTNRSFCPSTALLRRTHRRKKPCICRASSNGASETRTRDLLGAIQALSQLSYSPMRPLDGRAGLCKCSGVIATRVARLAPRLEADSKELVAGAVWCAGAWDCSMTPSANTWSSSACEAPIRDW